jgi:hypothetical protein
MAAIARIRGIGSGVSAMRRAARTKSAEAMPELPRYTRRSGDSAWTARTVMPAPNVRLVTSRRRSPLASSQIPSPSTMPISKAAIRGVQ